MSNETRLYGYINVPRWKGWNDALSHNQRAIVALPEDDEWPWLIRGMFSVSPERVSYRHWLIHFAADIKGLDEAWDTWLDKFESLLRQMRWCSVVVHLETEHRGDHRFLWIADQECLQGNVTKWDFCSSPDKAEAEDSPPRRRFDV